MIMDIRFLSADGDFLDVKDVPTDMEDGKEVIDYVTLGENLSEDDYDFVMESVDSHEID